MADNHLRKLIFAGNESIVDQFVAGDHITFSPLPDGRIRIDGEAGGAGGGSWSGDGDASCTEYSVMWDPDRNALISIDNNGTNSGVQQLTFNHLRIENGDTFFEIDTRDAKVSMSDDLREALVTALSLSPYETLEWIGSTNKAAAYIDTGLTMNGAYRFEVEGRTGTDSAALFFDSYVDSSNRQGGILYNRANPRYDSWWLAAGYKSGTTTALDYTEWFTLEQDSGGASITQNGVTETNSYSGSASQTGTTPILLFSSQRSDLDPTYTAVKSVKISQGGTLVRHFVPRKRKSDDAVGMLDLVNDVFYTNAGTGDFITA